MTIQTILAHVTVERIFTAILTVSTIAKAFCAATSTPDPKTTWGKLYNLIEILALTVGKAKQPPQLNQGATVMVTPTQPKA